ncbi:MAG: PAS domain S-box protein [Spirochaetales bacterium]|nr:PAS domain S-box protein [Spirochaetales bacterium]
MNTNDLYLEEHYKYLIDQSPFHVFYFDLELKILYINKYTRDFLCITNEEAVGKSILEFVPEETQDSFLKMIKRINKAFPKFHTEHMNYDNFGKEYWFRWTDGGIFNGDGELIGYQSMGQDITDKKKNEAELQKSSKRLLESQRVGNMGDWEWDIKNDVTFWSKQAYRIYGLAPDSVTLSQEFYREMIPEKYRRKLVEKQNEAFREHLGSFNLEYPFKRKDGSTGWVSDQARIEYDESFKPVRIYGTVLDITEYKELQVSLENLLEMESMVLNISSIFMKTDPIVPGIAVDMTMEKLGLKLNADRTYIVLNNLLCPEQDDVYEWMRNEDLSGMIKWDGTPSQTPMIFKALEDSDFVFISDVQEIITSYPEDGNVLKEMGIGAFLAVTLLYNNQICGYLCVDKRTCVNEWSLPDIDFLKIIGEMCVGALERIRFQRALKREKEFLNMTLMSIGDGFISLAPDGKIELINNRAKDLLGLKENDYQQRHLEDVAEIKTEDGLTVINFNFLFSTQNSTGQSYRKGYYKHPDGTHRILSYSCTLIPGRNPVGPGCALIFRDITVDSRRQDKISFLSFHDSLTGIYNRAFMEEELKRLDTVRQLPLSIIIGDVNGLKLANDVFGHKEGDNLLKAIAGIMLSCCREEDVIARWGGDEFSIILPKTDQKTADKICDRIRNKCEKTTSTRITPSIALGSASKVDPDELTDGVLREAEDRMYRQKLLDDRSVRSDILSSLKKSMFEKSYETEEHTKRMLKICSMFGKALNLPSNLQSDLNLLAIMHDMGKIAVPVHILGKIGPLTNDEWSEIQKHPEAGYRISQSSQELSSIADYILAHHERWDGTGYPRKLKGKEIPELSRIISIVDSYDVMTNGRVYKAGIPSEDALCEIEKCAGTQFDPELSVQFIKIMRG